MISDGFELLVIEIIGVIWSNFRIRFVAEIPSSLGMTISYDSQPVNSSTEYSLPNLDRERRLTINTRSYFSKFILFTAPTPSTATSIVHPLTCRNLLLNLLLTRSSSTKSTLGGTAHPGTYVDRRTLNVLPFLLPELVGEEVGTVGDVDVGGRAGRGGGGG